MTTQKIREQLEKLNALVRLYSNLYNSQGDAKSTEDVDTVILKMKTAKEEMLKVNYMVGQLLSGIEEKV